MTKRFLLFGKNGQLGWELQRALAPLGNLTLHDSRSCDFTSTEAVIRATELAQPDIIVNAAAYTAVDQAEAQQEIAHKVNAEATALLAQYAYRHNALLVHYSTDYVFDGTKAGAYSEIDTPNPVSAYGASKRQGEIAIIESGCRHLIFRTSWVFAARGHNFAKTILRLAKDREVLRVVADQYGAPTSAELIADITAQVLNHLPTNCYGLYHLAAAGETTWYEYANTIISRAIELGASLKVKSIEPISTADYPLPAKRPANSRLDCAKLQSAFKLVLPSWQYHADRMLVEIIGNTNAN